MGRLVRFSVSIDQRLIDRFDALWRERGYGNRSEAIRDAIRQQLIVQEWADDEQVAGVITLLYDHLRPGLAERITELQHRSLSYVLSTTHIHLDRDNCLELIAVKGDAGGIRTLADRLISLKGVKHGGLAATSTGERIV